MTFVACSNYACTVYNFRMPLIRRLKSEGHVVVVLSQFDWHEKIIGEEIDQIFPLLMSRKGINSFVDFLKICDFVRRVYSVKPNFILPFTIKPCIYGCIAARLTKVKSILMNTGLGTASIQGNWLRVPLKSWAESLLDESEIRKQGYFDFCSLQRLWEEHQAGSRNWSAVV